MLSTKNTSQKETLEETEFYLQSRKRRSTEQDFRNSKETNYELQKEISTKESLLKDFLSNVVSPNNKRKIKVKKVIKTETVFIQPLIELDEKDSKNRKKELEKHSENSIITEKTLHKISSENNLKKVMSRQSSGNSTIASSENSEKERKINIEDEKLKNIFIRKFNIPKNKKTDHIELIKPKDSNLRIEDFEILKECGKDSLGSKFIAKHKETGFLCILKKFLKASLKNNQSQEALIDEMNIHRKLNHPNIAKFYGFFSSESSFYIVLEFQSEMSLFESLKKYGFFDENEVIQIIRQVCNGVNYLHKNNIFHQNINSKKISIHHKTIKICDFRSATEVKDLYKNTTEKGTKLIENSIERKKNDIRSIGALTYELLFGQTPFEMRDKVDSKIIMPERLKFPSNIPISSICKNFILKCFNSEEGADTSKLIVHEFLQKEEPFHEKKY